MSTIISSPPKNESVSRTFWRYAVPSVAAMIVSGFYQVIDGFFVGHYVGVDGLAGINVSWPVLGVIMGFGILVGMGAGSVISIYRGENNSEGVGLTLSTSLWLMLGLGAVSSTFLYFGTDALMAAQNASGMPLLHAKDYLNVFVFGAVFTIGAGALPLLVRNDNSPNWATALTILGAVANIVLDYLLIGVMGLGLEGAAVATVISQALVVVGGLCYFLSRKAECRIQHLQFCIKKAMHTVELGSSTLFMFLYFSFVIAVHNYLLMSYGSSVYVGAYAILGYIATMYYLFSEGLANGMQPPVSYYYGARRFSAIKATVKIALGAILVTGFAAVALLNIAPEQIIALFGKGNTELIEVAVHGARLHLFAMFLDGLFFAASVFFISIDKGGKALFVSVGNMLVQLPFLYLLPKVWGVDGVWLAMPISNLVLALVVIPMLISELKKLECHSPSAAVPAHAS
ncbi:MATE family efflux transporter [Enterovibrio sp. ZSDZ35]|uniref:Multidrug export protein MepA n=1 Tax=Enterovibrio qingdaonensis TaxID=2899818 RepID=A0ABT5QIY9_9GAMM|nr:MATE family efflux transporter [Enterovibrio sp. ZSDZ35]MDD1780951.1 MATE family efflux transporter [Enterovibrio sp. ZSDZ35]